MDLTNEPLSHLTKTYQHGAVSLWKHFPTTRCPGDLCREQVLRVPPWTTAEGNTTAGCLLRVSWAFPSALACGADRRMLFPNLFSGLVLAILQGRAEPQPLPLELVSLKWSLLSQCPCCLCHLHTHLRTFIAAMNYSINLILQQDLYFCKVTSASWYAWGGKQVLISRLPPMSKPFASFHQDTSHIYGPALAICISSYFSLHVQVASNLQLPWKRTSKCPHWLWNNPDSLFTSLPAPLLSEQVLLPLLLALCGPHQKWVCCINIWPFDLYHQNLTIQLKSPVPPNLWPDWEN